MISDSLPSSSHMNVNIKLDIEFEMAVYIRCSYYDIQSCKECPYKRFNAKKRCLAYLYVDLTNSFRKENEIIRGEKYNLAIEKILKLGLTEKIEFIDRWCRERGYK